MPLLTFQQQIDSHLQFLQDKGLHVENLDTSGKFIRCHALGESEKGRGDYSYKSTVNRMGNGKEGIVTVARGLAGEISTHKTYGLPPGAEEIRTYSAPATKQSEPQSIEEERNAEEKARLYFEVYSSPKGKSEYLKKKGVRAIGLRFHSSEKHGSAAVVPARDITGKIKTCMNLNNSGRKSWLSGRSYIGAFHVLGWLEGASTIGLAEGYATAATCFEALEQHSIPVVCAFDANNLKPVAIAIKNKYPNARILFLADNDRHLEVKGIGNKGLESAQDAIKSIGGTSGLIAPDFGLYEPLKEFSDWNDLAREFGIEEVRLQIVRWLRENPVNK